MAAPWSEHRVATCLHWALLICTSIFGTPPAFALETLSPAQCTAIDSAVTAVLDSRGAPSASIAVVQDGKIVYEQAYGSARVEPSMPATNATRYSIGSVSKQFTAAAVLLLAEDKILSLDDKVARWLPEL